jgi:hypothetical protein
MDRLLASATIDCGECGEPTQRLEVSWEPIAVEGGLCRWVVHEAALVCDGGHRNVLELFS